MGRCTTVSLFNRAFESLVVSCLDRLGVDQLMVLGVGGGVRVPNTGSDSPSKAGASASWDNDVVSGSRVRVGRLIGASGIRGHCREEFE